MKHVLKSALGHIGARGALLAGRCFVLAYHRVLPAAELMPAEAGIAVSDIEFERQLEWLRRRFEIVPLAAMLEGAPADQSRRPRVALTFDDGWRDTYAVAGPIMKRHGITATVFLATGFVGTRRVFWWQQIAHLIGRADMGMVVEQIRDTAEAAGYGKLARALAAPMPEPMLFDTLKRHDGREIRAVLDALVPQDEERAARQVMTWEEVHDMSRDGHRFAPHTRNHDILTAVPGETALVEIEASYRDIADRGLNPLRVFAFPNGTSDEASRALVAKAGMDFAFGMARGSFRSAQNCRWQLPRVNVGHRNAPSLARFKYLFVRAGQRVW